MAEMNPDEYRIMYEVETEHWWYWSLRHRLSQVLASLKFQQPPNKIKVLDAGCGTGMNSVWLQEQGYQVWACDLSPLAVKFSHQRGVKQVKIGDLTKLPYRSHTFDLVLNLDVLGTLKPRDQAKAIAEFQRVLKPGGRLVLQAAALPWLFSQHDQVVSINTRFTYSQLEKLFSTPKNHWSILFLSYRFFGLFPVIALQKLLKQRQSKSSKQAVGDLELPPKFINSILKLIMWVENMGLTFFKYPIGSSLMIVAQTKSKKPV